MVPSYSVPRRSGLLFNRVKYELEIQTRYFWYAVMTRGKDRGPSLKNKAQSNLTCYNYTEHEMRFSNVATFMSQRDCRDARPLGSSKMI